MSCGYTHSDFLLGLYANSYGSAHFKPDTDGDCDTDNDSRPMCKAKPGINTGGRAGPVRRQFDV